MIRILLISFALVVVLSRVLTAWLTVRYLRRILAMLEHLSSLVGEATWTVRHNRSDGRIFGESPYTYSTDYNYTRWVTGAVCIILSLAMIFACLVIDRIVFH